MEPYEGVDKEDLGTLRTRLTRGRGGAEASIGELWASPLRGGGGGGEGC